MYTFLQSRSFLSFLPPPPRITKKRRRGRTLWRITSHSTNQCATFETIQILFSPLTFTFSLLIKADLIDLTSKIKKTKGMK